MGLMPHEFYDLEHEEFWLMFNGWHKEKTEHGLVLQRLTWVIHASMVQKPVPEEKILGLKSPNRKARVSQSQKQLLDKKREEESRLKEIDTKVRMNEVKRRAIRKLKG